MEKIETKFKSWKNKLLDLGMRNKLLNYKDTSKSSLKIIKPDYNELYEIIVKSEKDLAFPMDLLDVDSAVEEPDEEFTEFFDNGGITTNKSLHELQKVLRNLRNKSKTALDEQGVNILYLSFGFLSYKEADQSKAEYIAPIILVPVTLAVESIISPYVLHLHEDEIVLNPTLAYKLENDYGIKLPNYDDDKSLDEIFLEVESAVNGNGWKIKKEVGLSLFSFLKINMYADLNNHKDTILSNPIVRAIGGDASMLPEISDELKSYDFDSQDKPEKVFQIVDADSSQQEAILLANKGISFILQGPPGTGKSQTITNIIAESLANGKKVLFVSEKMAALEVVQKRLATAGLSDFCLELHSYKANKRSVLDQLDKSLKLSQRKADVNEEAYRKLYSLTRDRELLNEYAKQLFTKVDPIGKSIYDANGIIANLTSYKDIIFAIPDVEKTSIDQFNNYCFTIERYASSVGKMTVDINNNPWKDTNLKAVTNEFRHNFGSYFSELLPKIKKAEQDAKTVIKACKVTLPCSIDGIKNLEKVVSCLENSYVIPEHWITKNKAQKLLKDVDTYEKIQEKYFDSASDVIREFEKLSAETNINIPSTTEFTNENNIAKSISLLASIIRDDSQYSVWKTGSIEHASKLLDEAKDVSNRIETIKSELNNRFEKSIFDIDFKSMRYRFKTQYTNILKIFKKEYRTDKDNIRICCKEITDKLSDEEITSVLDKLYLSSQYREWFIENEVDLNKLLGITADDECIDFDTLNKKVSIYPLIISLKVKLENLYNKCVDIKKQNSLLKKEYDFLFAGLNTDWNQVRNSLLWASLFESVLSEVNPGDDFIKNVCKSKDFASECYQKMADIKKIYESLDPELEWFVSNFNDNKIFYSYDFKDLVKHIKDCSEGLSLLEDWIDYRSIKKECTGIRLADFVKAVEKNSIKSDEILPIFKKRFFRLWLDAILPQYPAVMKFRGKQQDDTINEFDYLDVLQFDIARSRIKCKLINNLPSMDHFTNGTDEISILKKELKKQRKIMPIRRLFKEIPNLLLTLKPCLMMSPLSVSLFLEADSYKFDIIIFDEASQVYTENAIGAISRGNQVVIAGDSKQLPPTNFFQSSANEEGFDDDEDNDDDIGAFESVLDEANMLPERTLQWHYRSRHESLIAFSNAKIYKNNLITFPSNIENCKDNGVEYIYVPEGYYDRGGKKGNVLEANKIADLVFEHFENNPNRSLGVIAFGEVQQIAIETAINMKRSEHQEFEPFFSEQKEEPFFIKNLENVQGDERDTIIFSIGYAKDASGAFRMQFGPLGKSGGERRLNVAITRAKYNVKLVGSIMPTEIDVDHITSEGPKLLRAYIDYAINGPSVLAKVISENDVVECDSPFEEAVYKFLDKKGYKVVTQVGCSGYRIDMAVKHPTISGVYIIGIECDGASYHSARTARERDRLRQEVLENMGWKIYRIWSTDWIKDPITEGNRLIEAVNNAISSYGENDHFFTEESSHEEYVNIVEKNQYDLSDSNIYGFDSKKEYSFSERFNYYDYYYTEDAVELVIKNEYPIHYDLLCQMVAGVFGNEKVTVKVRSGVDSALRKLKSKVIKKGDYLYPVGYKDIPIRFPNTRDIQNISDEELSVAMLKILGKFVGATRESLCSETARVYGFSRMGPKIQSVLTNVLIKLIKSGWISEVDGKLKNDFPSQDYSTCKKKMKCPVCGKNLLICENDFGVFFCQHCKSKLFYDIKFNKLYKYDDVVEVDCENCGNSFYTDKNIKDFFCPYCNENLVFDD